MLSLYSFPVKASSYQTSEIRYALVCGPDKSYLWILAREPRIKEDVKNNLIAKAAALGFETNKLIFVDQD